jgi:arabinogalactan endo-1,4-beta-galactosidase
VARLTTLLSCRPAQCTGDTAPELSEPSIPASVSGQLEWVHDIVEVVKGVPNGLGQGIHYWGNYTFSPAYGDAADSFSEPAWLNNTGLGSACQDAILFEPDWSHWPNVTGYSRASVNVFKGV